jgi:hypothetical protein
MGDGWCSRQGIGVSRPQAQVTVTCGVSFVRKLIMMPEGIILESFIWLIPRMPLREPSCSAACCFSVPVGIPAKIPSGCLMNDSRD